MAQERPNRVSQCQASNSKTIAVSIPARPPTSAPPGQPSIRLDFSEFAHNTSASTAASHYPADERTEYQPQPDSNHRKQGQDQQYQQRQPEEDGNHRGPPFLK